MYLVVWRKGLFGLVCSCEEEDRELGGGVDCLLMLGSLGFIFAAREGQLV